MVEFALIAPLLFTLLFGVVEFGWAFYQELNVRHGAREGIRLAAVDANPANGQATPAANIAKEVCTRMDAEVGGGVRVIITVDAAANIGDEVTVTVTKPVHQLTGLFSTFLDGVVLDSTVSTRLEQDPSFASIAAPGFAC